MKNTKDTIIAEVFRDALKKIKPDKKRITKVNKFLKEINTALKKNKIKAKAVLGGSYSKGVWLKEDYDVDIFVKFDLAYKDQDISKKLEKALKRIKTTKVHGSRDYFQVNGEINYELVPVLSIKNKKDAQNVTDFSPLHVKWVVDNVKRLRDDIRLMKKFCKAQNLYGAESYIKGFSGHVVDILIIHYGGFLKLLKAATKWKAKQIIDTNNIYKGKALIMMNKSKTEGPMILVDPIDPDRNAAAALGKEKFERFINSAKQFLKKPTAEFFESKKTDFEKLKEKGNLIVLDVFSLPGKKDVVGSKLLKAFEFLKKNLVEFEILDSGWEWHGGKKGEFWFVLKKDELPKTFTRKGPMLSQKEFVKEFKKKHKKTFKKGQNLYADIKRKTRTIAASIEKTISDKYFAERTKKCLPRY